MTLLRALIFLITLFIPLQALALDAAIENDLQKDLQQSKVILERAEAKIKSLQPADAEIKALINNLENIKASHLLLQERFRERQETVKTLGSKAVERQMKMLEGYNNALKEYINLIESLQPSAVSNQQIIINKLKTLLEKILFKKKRPILGTLPYKNLNYPAREPDTSQTIKPAYKGGDKVVTEDDLKDTDYAPLSEEIVTQAQSLNWNPVSIYEHVKNNIDTEWYWGCMKGAEETLRQGSGNDCDQATLLIALLRASGFPSRYVRGVIELEADKLKNLTRIDDELNIAAFLQKAGIPFTPVIKGGKIGAFEIEHFWVESEIPYANYRGAIIDEHGKMWLGLDTSIKVTGYEYNEPVDIFSEELAISDQLSAIRDEYLGSLQTQTPLDYLYDKIVEISGLTADSCMLTRFLIPEVMNILPASMQYDQKVITGELTDIPDELMHKVRFTATDSNNSELLNLELRTFKLSNQKIVISYEPETVEDQEIINSYGGLDNTPSYLVSLRPVLIVNGERIVVAKDGLPMGADYKLTIELISPNGTEKVENTHITGNLSVIGIVAQEAISSQQSAISEEDNAETIFFKEAINYIERWNQAEDELASLMHLSIARPIPTVVTIGGVIDVTYLLDMPHGFQWKGVYIDAALRATSPVHSSEFTVQSERQKLFMQLSALHGSILENRIFEDDFGVESISTAKLFTLNSELGTQNLTIDQTNIDTILPTLLFDDNIKEDIANAVNQGFELRTPNSELVFKDWTGLGYIKENPGTGEAGYMLSGMIAGGMSAWGVGRWPETYVEILMHPFTDLLNDDPVSARYIEKISASDFQIGEAGSVLNRPLQVKVTDLKGQPVKGAEVIFNIKAGGGKLISSGNGEFDYITVKTDIEGIAGVKFKLGAKTADNPTFMKLNMDDEYYTQLGENIIEALLAGTATKTMTPFTAFGKPGSPHKIIKAFGDGAKALVNSPAGSLRAVVVDEQGDEEYYGNPISNIDITFTATKAESMNPSVALPSTNTRGVELYKPEDCSNPYPLPGECTTVQTITLKTAYYGATVNTVLGNTVNTKYTVGVSAAGVSPVEFILYSDGYRDAGDYIPPGLYMKYLNIVNDKGEPVNASKAGTELKAPLTAELFRLYDEYKMEKYTCIKDGSPTDCWRINASGIVNVLPVATGTVTYTAVAGGGEILSTENLDNGKYEARIKTGSEPAVNIIEAEGEASITVPEVFYDPFTNKAVTEGYETETLPQKIVPLKSGQEVLFDRDTKLAIITTGYGKLIYTMYGVDVLIDTPLSAVLIDNIDVLGYGYSINDLNVSYTIEPDGYRATTAYVDLIEEDIPVNRIPSEPAGTGSATYAEGYQFNLDKKYEVQVILNPGTGTEVQSDKEELMAAKMSVVNEDRDEIEELRYSNGTNDKKRYHIELNIGRLFGAISCEDITAEISTRKQDGNYATVPGTEYPEKYLPLTFKESGIIFKKCISQNLNTDTGTTRSSFILTNLSKEAIGDAINETAPLYGGIGNKFRIKLSGALNGANRDLPIEPVGVIVIGIDGLRQDVLYPDKMDGNDFENVNDPNGNYYVNASSLAGLGQLLIGDPTKSSSQQYIMLPEVTSIFPSITLTSWASIFTGKMPGETGILGNEFFARDIVGCTTGSECRRVPPFFNPPLGMVTFSSGAFKGYDSYSTFEKAVWDFVPPVPATPEETSQNNILNLSVPTIYEWIKDEKKIRTYFEDGNDRSAQVSGHYARGVDFWATMDIADIIYLMPRMLDDAKALDRLGSYYALKYLNSNLRNIILQRNDVPFPALFTVYFGGLDHAAHFAGMGIYKDFFIKETDIRIGEVVDWLKGYGEFDNKIFIITSDHGHTAMPIFGELTLYPGTPDERRVTPDTSCKLKTKKFNKRKVQDSEKTNNNLHIWELGKMFQQFGQEEGLSLLVPKEIEQVLIAGLKQDKVPAVSSDINQANVIVALNGPMAHVYVKGASGWSESNSDPVMIGRVADKLNMYFGEQGVGLDEDTQNENARLLSSIDKILVRVSGNYKIFKGVTVSEEGSVTGLVTPGALTELESNQDYVNAVTRVEDMNHPKRSGDIILLMRSGSGGLSDDRYTTGVSCKSWHGSLNKSDSYIPFVAAYPGGNKYELSSLLDSVCLNNNCEGNWILSDLIKAIVETQYSGH